MCNHKSLVNKYFTKSIYTKINCRVYVILSLENGSTDLPTDVFVSFLRSSLSEQDFYENYKIIVENPPEMS